MKYLKRTALIFSAIILLLGGLAATASAQRRAVIIRRPVIVRTYNPFWGFGYGHRSLWDDPYYWQQRQEYYDRQSVRDAANKLRKDRQKFNSDGYLSPKEQEKLMKEQRNYERAVDRLRRDG